MRLLFLVTILINLVIFSAARSSSDSTVLTQRASQQIAPEGLVWQAPISTDYANQTETSTLLKNVSTHTENQKLALNLAPSASAPSAHATIQTANISSLSPSQPSASPSNPDNPPLQLDQACIEWGPFNKEELAIAQSWLKRRQYDEAKLGADGLKSWMVYLPSQATLAAANKKAAELKQLGIADFFILQESGPFKFAISLGVFRSEAAAQRYIQYLESRQLKNLNIVARGSNNSSLQWLILPTSTASLRKEIEASHFSSTDWRNCGNAQTPDKVTSINQKRSTQALN